MSEEAGNRCNSCRFVKYSNVKNIAGALAKYEKRDKHASRIT